MMRLLPVIFPILVFLGCLFDDKPKLKPAAYELQVRHLAGGADLKFEGTTYTNAAGNEFQITKLQYLLSQFLFKDDYGDLVDSLEGAIFIDALDPTTHTLLVPDAPEAHFHILNMTFGLDPDDNRAGFLSGKPGAAEMEWPSAIGGGYHFLKMEGTFKDRTGAVKDFKIHIGNDGRGGERHFVFRASGMHVDGRNGYKIVIPIEMDMTKWFEGADTLDFNSLPVDIRSDTVIQSSLQANGKKGAFNMQEARLEKY